MTVVMRPRTPITAPAIARRLDAATLLATRKAAIDTYRPANRSGRATSRSPGYKDASNPSSESTNPAKGLVSGSRYPIRSGRSLHSVSLALKEAERGRLRFFSRRALPRTNGDSHRSDTTTTQMGRFLAEGLPLGSASAELHSTTARRKRGTLGSGLQVCVSYCRDGRGHCAGAKGRLPTRCRPKGGGWLQRDSNPPLGFVPG
jgi:hypothetical protein